MLLLSVNVDAWKWCVCLSMFMPGDGDSVCLSMFMPCNAPFVCQCSCLERVILSVCQCLFLKMVILADSGFRPGQEFKKQKYYKNLGTQILQTP